MPRPIPQQSEPINADSFLDIVASVVSIMIVMVVMVGMRIKNAPVKVAIPSSPAQVELEKDQAAVASLRGDVVKMTDEIQQLEHETAARTAQRDMLATVAAAAEQKFQDLQKNLDAGKQTDLNFAREMSEARFQLDRINRQRETVENAAAAPVVVESYPTPISRAVDGPEAHLLIQNGRVVFVPLEALLTQFRTQAKRQARQLLDQPELTDTVGPSDGFRLRYTLERHDLSEEESQGRRGGGAYVGLKRWTLIPESNDLGEPVRLALAPDSDFHKTLSKILPGRTAITIWVYPDGFDAFRQIRRELYGLNYAIAARPLPVGESIAGSPDGSKSAAQ